MSQTPGKLTTIDNKPYRTSKRKTLLSGQPIKTNRKVNTKDMGIKKLTFTEHCNSVVVDLMERRDIIISRGVVDIKPEFNLTAIMWEEEINKTLQLRIENITIPDYVITRDGQDLLTLTCGEKRGSALSLDVGKKNSELQFEIHLSTAAIRDCPHSVNDFIIKYTIVATSGSKKLHKDDSVPVAINQINPQKPHLNLNEREILFKEQQVQNTIKITHPSELIHAPTLYMRALRAHIEDYRQQHGLAQVECAQAHAAGPNAGYVPDGGARMVPINPCNETHQNDIIGPIYPIGGYWIEVPVTMDLTNIHNPIDDQEEWKLVVEYEYWSDETEDNRTTITDSINFMLMRNNARYELRVMTQNDHIVNSGDIYTIPEINIGRADGFMRDSYTIKILNAANVSQDGNWGILLKNVDIKPLTIEDGVTFKREGHPLQLDDFIERHFNGAQIRGGFATLFPNTEGIIIDININPNGIIQFFDIHEHEVFSAKVRQHLEFDYTTDNRATWNHFEGIVFFELVSNPTQEWMALDFGTSAVVALYGNTFNANEGRRNLPNDYILNLSAQKEKILRASYDSNDDHAKVTDEKVFINSTIVLNNNGKREDNFYIREERGNINTNYRESKVLFSPGDQFDYGQLMPSLKSMMGHDVVPGRIVPVNDVFHTTYHMLFDLYLKGQSDRIEKIVLTYPNTFSANHIEKIKSIARECIPTLRPDYIVTLSESDAVAFDYLIHRNELLPQNELLDRDANDALNDLLDDTVLIYDMGAGTLDLTYFTNVRGGDVREIDIKGRYGLNKAGNYLDYVLAKIIVDLIGRNENIGGVQINQYVNLNNERTVDIGTPFGLKNYVKHQLKPMMADYVGTEPDLDNIMLPKWDAAGDKLDQISLKKVFEHDLFNLFIREISEDVVKGLRGNINDLNVHAVVFSGRMSLFKSIRSAVMQQFGMETREILISNNTDGHAFKYSVAEGALNYAEICHGNPQPDLRILPPRAFYCNFCVIVVRQVLGEYTYSAHCILTNRTGNHEIVEKINLRNAYAIYLVQTYASDTTSIINDFCGSRDTTTTLAHCVRNNHNGLFRDSVNVSITANVANGNLDNVRMAIENIYIEVLAQENLTSDSFRKSSWPVVF